MFRWDWLKWFVRILIIKFDKKHINTITKSKDSTYYSANIRCIFYKKWQKIAIYMSIMPPHVSPYICDVASPFALSMLSINHDDYPLRWRHNVHDGVSNHQPHHCLLNRLFGCRSKKTSTFRVTGLCAGNSPGTGEFLAQMASNMEMFPFDDVIMHAKNVPLTTQYAEIPQQYVASSHICTARWQINMADKMIDWRE